MSGIMMVQLSHAAASSSPYQAFDFINPPQLVSASFNGTNQAFLAPDIGTNAAFIQAGDFTVEAWYRPSNVTGTHYLFALGNETTNRYYCYLSGTSVATALYGESPVIYTSTVPINTWTHIAVVRSGSTVSVYINGTASVTTDTQAGTIGNGQLRIGIDNASPTGYFEGRISNFRVASSAVYTGNFTTPTKPLSPTGAAFFMSMGLSPFVDYSTNAITVTNFNTIALADSSPFPATWTDSINGIVATVATNVNSSGNNPVYNPTYGGGLIFSENPRQTYVDVPTARGGGAFTISLAANIGASTGAHYNAIFCSNINTRTGNGIMSRHWVGDGLEAGITSNWITGGFPTMGALAWYDYVYNGTSMTLYKNGSSIGSGTLTSANEGWLNPLRFGADESVSANNTMAPSVLYRMKHQTTALSAAQVTAQFNAVRSTYGL